MHTHRSARISALQALYELDTTDHLASTVIAHRLNYEPLPPDGEAFLRRLISGVVRNRSHLDALIQKYAPAWPVDQIAVVDRNLLRIALYELSEAMATPPKVAINEAVDLAKTFGSDNSSRFINGVLGSALSDKDRASLASPALPAIVTKKD